MKSISINTAKGAEQLASKSVEFVLISNVTPDVAQWFLDHQIANNRNLDKKKVNEYARSMKEGNWYTDAPANILCFGKDGRGISLQHRMAAIIETGTTQHFYAQLGCSNSEYGDIGKARTMNDRLHMNGVSDDFNKSVTTLIRNIFGLREGSRVPSTTSPKTEYTYEAYAEFVDANRQNLKEVYEYSALMYDIPGAKKGMYAWGGSRLQRVCVESYMFVLHFDYGWDWDTITDFFSGTISLTVNENPVIEKIRSMFANNANSNKVAKFSTLYIDYAVHVYFNTYAVGNLKATKVMTYNQYMSASVVAPVVAPEFTKNCSHQLHFC